MLNKIFLMGRLTRDPEMRHTQNGTAVASFSIAVDRDFKDKQSGEKVTDFVDIVAWRSTAEFVDKYFSKGRMAVVEGRLQIRDWTDKDGNKRRSAEVVADSIYFGDSKRDGDSGGTYHSSGRSSGVNVSASDFIELGDDDGELFCDNYCRWPRECPNQDELEDKHCDSCDLIRVLNLGL